MGKIYKDKKSKGCALCKPHKHGWDPKKKAKVLAFERETEKTSGITAMEDMGRGLTKENNNPPLCSRGGWGG